MTEHENEGNALEPLGGAAVDADPTTPAPAPRPRRRLRGRIVLAAVVVTAAASAAGFALTSGGGPARVGSGVVVIETNLGYQDAQAAGTGMVLTSSGTVLTNNHVIRGATQIRVVDPTTGRKYSAQVVGYDTADDIAVLRAGASNLKTIPLGDSSSLSTGDAIKALGNAGGTGSLRPAAGTITGLGRGITVSDDQGGSESLSGMIQTNAPIQPGDSGGPLMDSSGHVVGMDTAASVANDSPQETASQGFAIPIDKAMSIAQQITRGEASGSIHVGGTAFLGVEVEANSYGGSGAVVTSVVPGSPAENAGLVPGDVITSVGDQTVSSPDGLTEIVALGSGPPR